MSWSNSEVRALIAIWGEDIQSQLDGAARNKSIFETISKKMLEVGYSRDWKQCCCKIKNLKSIYKKTKDHNGITGNGRKTFKFYNHLDQILGHRPASVPSIVVDTQDSGDDESDIIQHDLNESDFNSTTAVPVESATQEEPIINKENESPKPSKPVQPKKVKKTKGERFMEKAIEGFMKYQAEAEEKFMQNEEDRWKREVELEEKRRREDQEHEIRLFQMLGEMLQPPTASPFDYEY